MNVEERLNKIREMDEAINRKIQRKTEIMCCATKITPGLDGMPHAPGVSDKVGNAAQCIVDLEAEIDRDIDALVAYEDDMCKLISILPKLQYNVLLMFYVQGMSIVEIGDKLHYSPQYMGAVRRQALQYLEKRNIF